MLVSLIGKNKILSTILPDVAEGVYWIRDDSGKNEKKLISIEGKANEWFVTSNKSARIINSQAVVFKNDKMMLIPNNDSVIGKIALKVNETHFITFENDEDIYVLYCSNVYDKDLLHFDIKDHADIFIGKNTDNDITYTGALVEGKHARLFFDNDTWNIENYDKKYGTYVNDYVVRDNTKKISSGDVIFIMGLKIVVVGDSIFVNNPMDKMRYIMKSLIPREDKQIVKNNKDEDENAIPDLYTDKDYFSRAPRIVNKIEKEKVVIDSPPAAQSNNQMPAILTMGSSLSMGVMTMMTMYTTMDAINNHTATLKQSMPRLIMSAMMLVSMILIPILTRKWEKHEKKRFEKKRQLRYRKYINSKIVKVNGIMDEQRKILNENHVTAEECEKIILEKDARLWERKIEDHDFLAIRAGTGDVPLEIDVTYPKESFAMEDDNLVEILNSIATQSRTLDNAPIALSLAQKNISSVIVQNDEIKQRYMKNIIMQLIALHSYVDLKIAFLVKEDKQDQWDYVKMLPHVWNSTNQVRLFADNSNDMKTISKYLEEVLENRAENVNERTDYKQFSPYYLIITDDYKQIENLKIITDVLKLKQNLGFSLLCITDDLTQLPNECKTFVTVEENGCRIFESENSATTQKEFVIDADRDWNFAGVSKVLSNIPIKYSASGSNLLPSSYTFLEMYDVGRVEQLNVYDRWKNNDTTISLQSLVGIDATGVPVSLDVHEKYHGPHGLIAGSTGSGKSEFIITYILSLAINYHPDDVNFVLIDYKGGGLAGAFQKRDIKLPHLVGTITNIDTVGLQRSLASIQSELRKRQILFNKARDMTDESTIDIYKYQKLYHDGVVKKPIPHLFIICDEFAELKQQQPDFMDELISVARIGRSLGVHLILATQKPAGIVNDQIRSNSKFGVCLKVQDRSDSVDVIKRPDAAKLKRAGQFYLSVGNDELFVLGQSGWAGAGYIPSDITKKEIDTSVEFISNTGNPIKKMNNKVKKKEEKSQGDQLTSIVEHICNIAKEKNIVEEQMWLESIPENIYLKDIRKKYNYKHKKNIINPVIGEYDDPSNQKQGILTLNYTENGNTIIYGSADSGKETLLSTIIYDTITTHSSEEVAFYVLDFGSEALKVFKSAPQIGDIVTVNDKERVSRLIEMLKKEIEERKKILSEYNGDYGLYLSTTGNKMPTIMVMINNYAAFSENYQDYEEDIQMITRESTKCGIIFTITANSYRDIRFRLIQNFKQKLALQLNNDDDYLYIFEKIGRKRASNLYGRGLVPIESEGVFEFQTAKICDIEKQNDYIKNMIQKIKSVDKHSAKSIPIMPEIVKLEHVKEKLNSINSLPLGINKKTLNVAVYNFKKRIANIIVSKDSELVMMFANNLAEEAKLLKNINVIVFTPNDKFDDIMKKYDEVNQAIISKSKDKEILCIIEDIDKFGTSMPTGINEFDNLFKNAAEANNCHFILVDNATKFKAHQFDAWYKNYISNDTGIWVGNGVDNQFVITTEINRKTIVSNCGISYGYIINQSVASLIKLVGMKEKEEEDE